MLSDLQVEV